MPYVFDDEKPAGGFVFDDGAPALTPEDAKRGVSVTDYLKSLATGALSGVGMTFRGAGMPIAAGINKVGEALGYKPELRSEDPLAPLETALRESRTPAAKAAIAGTELGGEWTKPSTWTMGKNPSASGFALQTAEGLGQYVPQFGVAAATGGLSVPAQFGVGATIGALQGAGGGAEDEADKIARMGHDELMSSSAMYRDLIANKVSPNAAKDAVSKAAQTGGAWGQAIPSGLETGVENVIIGALTRGAPWAKALFGGGGIARKVATGVAGGALTQGLEEGGEQMSQNIGSNIAIGGNRPIGADTFSNAALGAASGGVAGGAGGVVSHVIPDQEQPKPAPKTNPVTAAVDRAATGDTKGAAAELLHQAAQDVVTGQDRLAMPPFTPGKEPYSREFEALTALRDGTELTPEDAGFLAYAGFAKPSNAGLLLLPRGRRRLREIEQNLAQQAIEDQKAADYDKAKGQVGEKLKAIDAEIERFKAEDDDRAEGARKARDAEIGRLIRAGQQTELAKVAEQVAPEQRGAIGLALQKALGAGQSLPEAAPKAGLNLQPETTNEPQQLPAADEQAAQETAASVAQSDQEAAAQAVGQENVPSPTTAPKTVAGTPAASHTDEQLQAIAAAPETPANTRHAAVAALQAREQLQETVNALQEQVSGTLDVRQQAGNGEALAKGNAQPEGATGTSAAEAKPEAQWAVEEQKQAGGALTPSGAMYVERAGQRFPVESFEDASKKLRAVMETTKAARARGEDVSVPADTMLTEIKRGGRVVAFISRNGRVWPPEKLQDGKVQSGIAALYDPYAGIPAEEGAHPDNMEAVPTREVQRQKALQAPQSPQPEAAPEAPAPEAAPKVAPGSPAEAVASDLRSMAGEAGWAERGGKLLRSGEGASADEIAAGYASQVGPVIGRTKWLAKAPWFAKMRQDLGTQGLSQPGEIQKATEDYIAGKPLNAKAKRTVDWMLAEIEAERDAWAEQEQVQIERDVSVADLTDAGIEVTGQNLAEVDALASALAAMTPEELATVDEKYGHLADDQFREAVLQFVKEKPNADQRANEAQAGAGEKGHAQAQGQEASQAEEVAPPGAAEAIAKHGLPADTGWKRGMGLAKGRWMAQAEGESSNPRDTADEAAAELRDFLDAKRRREEKSASIAAAQKLAADKVRAGENPTFAEWKAAFPQLREGHTYLRQPDISPFLVEHFGFSKARIREPLGRAAGNVTSDSGAQYPIVYFNRLAEVLGKKAEERPALTLEQPAPSELAARAAQAAAEAAKQAAESVKQMADEMRGAFQLTGSARAADELAARGQTGLFEAQPAEAQKPAHEQEYDAAREEFRIVSRAFADATKRYRAREIGDAEYLDARKKLADAQDAFDAAETKFIEASNQRESRDSFTVDRVDGPVTFRRGEWVGAWISNNNYSEGEIVGISHAEKRARVLSPDSMNGEGQWFEFGRIYKAERPVEEQKPTVPLSKVVESANKKNGEGLTEADRIQTLATFDDFFSRLRDGNVTPEEFKATFESVTRSRDALIAELSGLTKDQLLKRMGGMAAQRYRGDKKERVVEAAYQDMLSDFTLSRGISYMMGGKGSYEAALRKMVEGTTEADLKTFADRVAEARKARQERLDEYRKAIDNPETIDDFRKFIEIKGEEALSPEQRRTYDELVAENRRARREAERTAAGTVQASSQQVNAKIIETKHTRDGYPLFVVQLDERVSREDYIRLLDSAKKLGGWYSKFRGNGAVPGFQFKTKESAEAFQKLSQTGDTEAVKEAVTERKQTNRAAKKNAAAERLAEMADRMEEAGNESLGQDRLANTARRARMAGYAEGQARADIAMARTLRNLSDAIESGQAKHLDGIRARTHVEELNRLLTQAKYDTIRAANNGSMPQDEMDRAPRLEDIDGLKYPEYTAYGSDIQALARDLSKVPGALMAARRLAKAGEADKRFVIKPALAEEALDKVARFNAGKSWANQIHFPYMLDSIRETRKRLKAMGLESAPELRAALREFLQYRGERPAEDRAKTLERALAGNPNVGIDYFPTPEDLANRMAETLDVKPGMTVLEPSAGNGNLADAVRAAQPDAEIDTVEMSGTLREILEAKGYNIAGQDFTEFGPEEKYDRIIMNPPFSNRMDAEHVRHAYELLKSGGRLVAITGEGVFNGSDQKARDFREWLDSVSGSSEQLSEAFTDRRQVRTTGVASRMLVIDKPESSESRMNRMDSTGYTGRGMPREDVVAAVEPIVRAAKNLPHLNVLEDWKKAPKALRDEIAKQGAQDDVRGAFHDGELWLFANRLGSPEDAQFVAFHEGAHYGLRGIFGGELDPVLMQIYRTNEKVRKAADALVPKGYSRVRATEEILADMAGRGEKPSGWDKIVALFRNFARRLGLMLDFSDADVLAILSQAKGYWMNRQRKGYAHLYRGTVFSEADQTETEAFRKWFGASKVVDAEGKPLVVYHGGWADIEQFEPTQGGIFFSESPKVASAFAAPEYAGVTLDEVNSAGMAPNVAPVYLAISKPMPLKGAQFKTNGVFDEEKMALAIRVAKDNGFDGLKITGLREAGGTATQWVAFRSEQIKSAYNRGTFDPSNPDIRFSRGAGAVASARTVFDDLTRSDRALNRVVSKVNTPYHLAQVHPEFKPVYEEAQDFTADVSRFANEAADQAQDLLPRIESFKDFSRKAPGTADVQRIADALYAGTLWGGGSPMDGRVWTDAELKSGRAQDGDVSLPAFEPLNDQQIKLYRQALAAANQSLAEHSKALIWRLAKIEKIALLKDATLAEMAENARDQADGMIEQIKEDMALKEGLSTDREEKEIAELEAFKKNVADIEDKTNGLIEHGYFPAMRFGAHFVNVQKWNAADQKWDEFYFGRFETQTAANLAKRELAKEYPDAVVSSGVMNDDAYKLFQGLNMDALELFAKHMRDEEGNPIDKDPIMQQYLRVATTERSSLKRQIHRKGTPGFSKDVPRALAQFVVSNATAASRAYHAAGMREKAMKIKAGDLQQYATRYVTYLQDPQEEAQFVRGLLANYYILGTLAFGAVNMTQPVLMTAPYLSQYTSWTKAMTELAKAAKDIIGGRKNLTPAEKAAYEKAVKQGIVSPQEIHQIRAESRTSMLGDSPMWQKLESIAESKGMKLPGKLLMRKAAFLWGSIYSLTEQFNRGITFLAAYRIAQDTDRYEFARQAVDATQGVYNRGNRPAISRGMIGATAMTFKQFSISYLELAKRLYATDRKAFAVMMLTLFVLAGLEGLPFAEDIEDLIDAIGQALGYGTNSKKKLRKLATDTLGKDIGDVMLHGFSAIPGMPLDVSMRLGMQNLIPGSAALKASEPDKTKDLLELVGPVGSLARNLATAGQAAATGDLSQSKLLLPKGFQDAIKGVEMGDTGVYKDFRGRKVTDTTMADAMVKFVGFQPAKVARESRIAYQNQQDIALQRVMESAIAGLWAEGIAERDTDKIVEARQRLRDWNEKNESMPIRIQTSQLLRRVREMKADREGRMIRSAPKEMRGEVARDMRQ